MALLADYAVATHATSLRHTFRVAGLSDSGRFRTLSGS